MYQGSADRSTGEVCAYRSSSSAAGGKPAAGPIAVAIGLSRRAPPSTSQ